VFTGLPRAFSLRNDGVVIARKISDEAPAFEM